VRWCAIIVILVGCRSPATAPGTKAQLGEQLFNDPNLSRPAARAASIATIRRSRSTDPEGNRTSAGAVRGRVGPRNSPTLLYASYIPPLHRDAQGRWVGGLFWTAERTPSRPRRPSRW